MLLGIAPPSWGKTPYTLWLEKTSPEPPEDNDSPILKRGRRVEPYICEVLQQDRGMWIVDRNKRVPHPEYSFLWAESDFTYVIDESKVFSDVDGAPIAGRMENTGHGEAKSVGYNREGWGVDGSQDVPAYYLAQVYFALACNGLSEATIAAAFSYDELRCYHFEAEPEIQAVLVKEAVNFWENHVLAGVPPAAKTLDDSKLMLEKLGGFTWEASAEAAELHRLIREKKDKIKGLEQLVEIYEKEFIDTMLLAATVHGVTEDGTRNFKALGPDGKAIATYNTITRKAYSVGESTYKQLRWSK